jgi:hypothetical protein
MPTHLIGYIGKARIEEENKHLTDEINRRSHSA